MSGSLLAYCKCSSIAKVRWTIEIAKRFADASAFEVSRHVLRPTRIGTALKIEGLTDNLDPELQEVWDAALRDVVSDNISVASPVPSSERPSSNDKIQTSEAGESSSLGS